MSNVVRVHLTITVLCPSRFSLRPRYLFQAKRYWWTVSRFLSSNLLDAGGYGYGIQLYCVGLRALGSRSSLCHLLPSITVQSSNQPIDIVITHTYLHLHTMNRILSAVPSSSRSTMVMARPAARSALSTPFARSTISSARLYSTRPTPEGLDEGERNIYDKLSAKFPGKTLEVQDVSGKLHGSPDRLEKLT